jgi:hypothetical protein
MKDALNKISLTSDLLAENPELVAFFASCAICTDNLQPNTVKLQVQKKYIQLIKKLKITDYATIVSSDIIIINNMSLDVYETIITNMFVLLASYYIKKLKEGLGGGCIDIKFLDAEPSEGVFLVDVNYKGVSIKEEVFAIRGLLEKSISVYSIYYTVKVIKDRYML